MKRGIVGLLIVLAACSGTTRERVIVAAGTTLVDSGLLDAVATRFEARYPDIELSVVGEATARVLELGRRGGADVLITHAPQLEANFVQEGLAARYELVWVSSFVLVGPPDRADGVAAERIAGVMGAIADQDGPFVSRADGSGTYETEQELWAAAGVDPRAEEWYAETGQGMGLTLLVADQREAFTVSELGAYLAAADTLSLVPIAVPDPPENPYHLIVVTTSEKRQAGEKFLDWLLSSEGRQAVGSVNRDLFGRMVYAPAS